MIKQFIRDILPYGFIVKRRKNRTLHFNTESKTEIKDTDLMFDSILSIQGFGCSGHTALINLFQEYKCVQECTHRAAKGENSYEIDFMRLGGGVLEYEKFLDSNNIFQNDAAYHRLLRQLGSCVIFHENEICKKYADNYLSQLIDFKLSNLSQVYYNVAIENQIDHDNSIYYIKNLSIDQFRSLTKNFLFSMFNVFKTEEKRILMLDHFFTDYEFNAKCYNDYIPDVKIIVLARDPRDVYYFAKLKKIETIPHDSVIDFVKWCKITYKYYNSETLEYYPLRFEQLVLDYDNTVAKLEKYVGLNPNEHVDKFKFLDPEKSKNNIGIWRQATELKDDMDVILKEMPHLCYMQK